MRRSLALIVLIASSGFAEVETSGGAASLSIGPDGVRLQAPAGAPGVGVEFDGRYLSTQISVTGSRPGAVNGTAPAPARILPVAPSGPSPLTDSDTFFRSMDRPRR